MTPHDSARLERALSCDMDSIESLQNAIVGLQSTDHPSLLPLHDVLMNRLRTLEAAALEPKFVWNAEEALKLLDRNYQIVLIKDGLGDITALAIPKGTGLSSGVQAWRDHSSEEIASLPLGASEEAQKRAIRRSIFEGPDKYSGGGRSVAQALHCLTEKAVFDRLPDGKGGYFEKPPKEPG